jgi:hypothetical protein
MSSMNEIYFYIQSILIVASNLYDQELKFWYCVSLATSKTNLESGSHYLVNKHHTLIMKLLNNHITNCSLPRSRSPATPVPQLVKMAHFIKNISKRWKGNTWSHEKIRRNQCISSNYRCRNISFFLQHQIPPAHLILLF